MIPDEFFTIDEEVESEFREKASRFLAIAFPATSRQEAEDRLLEIRKKYHDATHHCFAYRIFEDDLIERSSDDGEPSGTAGKPILRAIEKFKYYELCVVVVRWFGGTKLGTGGLVRAYGRAADVVLQSAVRRQCEATFPVEIRFSPSITNSVFHVVVRFHVYWKFTNDGENMLLIAYPQKKNITQFTSSIAGATRGAARIAVGNKLEIIRWRVRR